MTKMFGWGPVLVLVVFALNHEPRAAAQTVQGDILRGQGAFLAGAGWYNLNTARANNINVDTWKKYKLEVQRLYRSYLEDRYLHIRYKKKLRHGAQDEFRKKYEEDQRWWREAPTPDDIASGEALNALAGDLADPSIVPTSCRSAEVALPPELSLKSLAFRIADRNTSSILQSTVASDRLLIADGWPIWLRRPELRRQEQEYEARVRTVVDKCRQGTPLEASDVDKLRDAVIALQKKVAEAVPARDNKRSKALEYVNQLDGATRIFAEQTYAERLIRDVT
jgi:hypothetical protein